MNGVPVQTPFKQRSFLVQATLSLHGKALLFVQACLLVLLQSCKTAIYHSGNICLFLKQHIILLFSLARGDFYTYPLLIHSVFACLHLTFYSGLRKVSLFLQLAPAALGITILLFSFSASCTVSAHFNGNLFVLFSINRYNALYGLAVHRIVATCNIL